MKLNQIIAIEKGVKSRTTKTLSELHKVNQKESLFSGHTAVFEKSDEDYQNEPDQKQVVQVVADDVLRRAAQEWADVLDVTATKDYANQGATANVIVDGKTLIANAPVPFLLSLEKRLADIGEFVTKIPVLSESEEWTRNESGISKSEIVRTRRTMKLEQPIVLYDATPDHPAQTQMITKDVTVGFWRKQHLSGALPSSIKRSILARINRLGDAVKQAREEANSINIEMQNIGKDIFSFIYGTDVKLDL